jgi:uncharacterized protein (DUF885 family)
MKIYCLSLSVAALLALSCAPQQTADQKFEALAKNYIEKLLEMKPEWATSLGDHRYDGRLNDYSMAGVEADRGFNRAYGDSLARIDPAALSAVNRIDYKIMRMNVEAWLFSLDGILLHTMPGAPSMGSSPESSRR